MTETKTAWIVGATGLVGRATVAALCADPAFGRVVAFVRRPLGLSHPKLEARVVDFESLAAAFSGGAVDVAVCCLGTTIKQAGSASRFRRVDHDYVLAFAGASKAAGARHLLVITALGANARSLVLYNRVKGEVERELSELRFEALTIARPSLLLGERSEVRIGEKLAAPFSRFLPARLRGIEGATVARALVRLAAAPARGERFVPSEELQRLGQ